MTSSSIDFESNQKFTIQFHSRSISDPPLSDIDLKYGLGLNYPFENLVFILLRMIHAGSAIRVR